MSEGLQYESVIELPGDLAIGTVPDIMEKIRERAFPTLETRSQIPVRIRVIWELAPGEDGWDLFETVREVMNDIEAYVGTRLDMPRPRLTTTERADAS